MAVTRPAWHDDSEPVPPIASITIEGGEIIVVSKQPMSFHGLASVRWWLEGYKIKGMQVVNRVYRLIDNSARVSLHPDFSRIEFARMIAAGLPDGSNMPVRLIATLAHNVNGRQSMFLGVIHDIKQNEAVVHQNLHHLAERLRAHGVSVRVAWQPSAAVLKLVRADLDMLDIAKICDEAGLFALGSIELVKTDRETIFVQMVTNRL